MSAALRRDDPSESMALARRRSPRIVLVGPPRVFVPGRDEPAIVIVGSDGDWRDRYARLAQKCNPGAFLRCGCPRDTGCSGSCRPNAPPDNGNQVDRTYNPNDPIDCNTPGWTRFTINNNAVVAAGASGFVSWVAQAPFQLGELTLSAAQAADFTNITIQVADVSNVLPAPVDGTVFSIAAAQPGTNRIVAPLLMQGGTLQINYTSAAGTAASAARFTLGGVYRRTQF